MCGIAGLWNLDGRIVDTAGLKNARDKMALRGPDDAGLWAEGSIGLAHRRLAIIDVSPQGHQPMRGADGRKSITFNGEIYNYRELRAELESCGHTFRTHSDTEVLLEGYERWGMDRLLRRCRGMWAFALWDGARRQLLLARDRVGKKPLFYSVGPARVSFASSLPALMNLEGRGREISPTAMAAYLQVGYVPPDDCIYEGVSKLPPGSWALFDESGRISVRRFWELKYQTIQNRLPEEWEEAVESSLREAVKDRLVADVPVAAFLSGGLDSSTIVSFMAELGPTPRTFTMSVPGSWRDESASARLVAERYGTIHTEIPLDAGCIREMPFLAMQFGEPFADSSAIPCHFVAKRAVADAKVILTGDGGDEVFGGYGRLGIVTALEAWHRRIPAVMRPAVRAAGELMAERRMLGIWRRPEARARLLRAAGGGTEDYFRTWLKMPGWRRRQVYGSRLLETLSRHDPAAHFLRASREVEAENWMHRVLATDAKTTLVGDFLVKVDVACMAASLEARCPMLDHRLMELMASMPLDLWQEGGSPKGFFRRIARKRLPDPLLTARKHGFTIPAEDFWGRGWDRWVETLVLEGGTLVQDGWLTAGGIRRLLRSAAAKANTSDGLALYFILCLELWHRLIHLGQPVGPAAELMVRGK